MDQQAIPLTPLPGNSIVEMESMLGTNTGDIVLPESIAGRPVYVGRIVRSVMSQQDKRKLGTDTIDGARVLVANHIGRHIGGRSYVFPNTYKRNPRDKKSPIDCPFLAILPADFKMDVAPISDEVPRCRYCGPAKSETSQNNVFMQHHRTHGWYCVRCNRTQDGTKINPLDVEAKDGYAPELYPENRVKWTKKIRGKRTTYRK